MSGKETAANPMSTPTPATPSPKCSRSASVTAASPRKYAVAACAAVLDQLPVGGVVVAPHEV